MGCKELMVLGCIFPSRGHPTVRNTGKSDSMDSNLKKEEQQEGDILLSPHSHHWLWRQSSCPAMSQVDA